MIFPMVIPLWCRFAKQPESGDGILRQSHAHRCEVVHTAARIRRPYQSAACIGASQEGQESRWADTDALTRIARTRTAMVPAAIRAADPRRKRRMAGLSRETGRA